MCLIFFFQAEDGIRDSVASRGLGDVYKRQLPSQANFIFASPGSNKRSATEIFKSLDEQNILVRHWDKKDLKDWLRITIGTEEEMQKLFDALQRNKQTQ